MKATNIKWDTDGNKKTLRYLPKKMEIPSGMYDLDDISDYLSDETGFCHDGFFIEYDKDDVKEYLESHLEENDLGGVEITEEDIDAVLKEANIFGDLEFIADAYLSSIRDVLDEGLESEKEDLE